LLSFEFKEDQFLAVSIEARLRKDDVDSYDPIKGLFRGDTKTIVLATAQDVIGLGIHIRGKPFYLYKLEFPELYSKPLLLNFLREAQALNTRPTLDIRILLPGNSDEMPMKWLILIPPVLFPTLEKKL
jgi:hypothetical protein